MVSLDMIKLNMDDFVHCLIFGKPGDRDEEEALCVEESVVYFHEEPSVCNYVKETEDVIYFNEEPSSCEYVKETDDEDEICSGKKTSISGLLVVNRGAIDEEEEDPEYNISEQGENSIEEEEEPMYPEYYIEKEKEKSKEVDQQYCFDEKSDKELFIRVCVDEEEDSEYSNREISEEGDPLYCFSEQEKSEEYDPEYNLSNQENSKKEDPEECEICAINGKHGNHVEEEELYEEECEIYFHEEPSVCNYVKKTDDEDEICSGENTPVHEFAVDNRDEIDEEEEDPEYNISEQGENSVDEEVDPMYSDYYIKKENPEIEVTQYWFMEEDENPDRELSIYEGVEEEEDPEYNFSDRVISGEEEEDPQRCFSDQKNPEEYDPDYNFSNPENSGKEDSEYYFGKQEKFNEEDPLMCEHLDYYGHDCDEEEDPQYCEQDDSSNEQPLISLCVDEEEDHQHGFSEQDSREVVHVSKRRRIM